MYLIISAGVSARKTTSLWEIFRNPSCWALSRRASRGRNNCSHSEAQTVWYGILTGTGCKFQKFFKRADPSRQGHKTVRQFHHQPFPFKHGGHHMQLRQSGMENFLVPQRLHCHADHPAARRQGRCLPAVSLACVRPPYTHASPCAASCLPISSAALAYTGSAPGLEPKKHR